MKELVSCGINNKKILNSIVGIVLMFVVTIILEPVPYLTLSGRQVIGVLIGSLYLWNTINSIWDSLLVPVALGFTSFISMNQIMGKFLGSGVYLQYLFMMILMTNLVHHNIPTYIGRFIITRKFLQGRPWIFTYTILIASYLLATLIGPFAPIFILWPVSYEIFAMLNYTTKDRFPKIILVGIIICALFGFSTPIYLGYPLGLSFSYTRIMAELGVEGMMISTSGYLFMAIGLSILMIIFMVIASMIIFRPNLEPLRNFKTEDANKNPLQPLSKSQKYIIAIFTVYVFSMLIPSMFPTLPVVSFLSDKVVGLSVLAAVILMAIEVEGKPLLELNALTGKGFAWQIYFRICAAFMIGNAVTAEGTGVGLLINNMLAPIFNDMSYLAFAITIVLITLVFANIFNSLIVSMLIQPVIAMYCIHNGINPTPIIALMIFYTSCGAAILPGGSPIAVVMFTNKEWLSRSDIFKYSGVFVIIITLVTIVVGIPLTQMLF